MLNNIEKGDIVSIRKDDGSTKSVHVLSVKTDYEHPGAFIRFDYIDYTEASPMRRTAYPKELLAIIRKNAVKPVDPKVERPGDAAPKNAESVIFNGEVYVKKSSVQPGAQIPVNTEANKQVHPAAVAPAKPVTTRENKPKTTAAAK